MFEGDVFNAKKIEESKLRLKKLDFFETVDVVPVDTPQKDVMDLNVKVKEKQTGSISFGGGYSSEDGAFVTGGIQQKNVAGTGDSVSLKAYLGQLASRYILSYSRPYIFGTQLTGGIDLYDWLRAYQDFTKDSIGFKLRVGYPLGQYSSVTAFYGWESAKMDNLDLIASVDPLFRGIRTTRSRAGLVLRSNEIQPTIHFCLPKASIWAPLLNTTLKILAATTIFSSKSIMRAFITRFFGNSSGMCVPRQALNMRLEALMAFLFMSAISSEE